MHCYGSNYPMLQYDLVDQSVGTTEAKTFALSPLNVTAASPSNAMTVRPSALNLPANVTLLQVPIRFIMRSTYAMPLSWV